MAVVEKWVVLGLEHFILNLSVNYEVVVHGGGASLLGIPKQRS